MREVSQEVEGVVQLRLRAVGELGAEVFNDPIVNVVDVPLCIGKDTVLHAVREARCCVRRVRDSSGE